MTATWTVVFASFIAALVEFVEALTIVLAMGLTRGWRSALAGAGTAVLALVAVTVAAGYALRSWLPQSVLQLGIGTLLLIFGLQWLRKAVLRASGRKAMHDEAAEFGAQTRAAQQVGDRATGIDGYGFVVSLKGVFLEGVEVVFIVITFGLNAGNVPAAAAGAAAAGLLVVGAGIVVHRPLTAIPENLLKYGVGLALATFGTFWSVEGLHRVIGAGGTGDVWPGGDWAILGLAAAWWLITQLLIRLLSRPAGERPTHQSPAEVSA